MSVIEHSHQGPFVRGYVLARAGLPAPVIMDWKRVSLGSGYELRFHSKTEVSTVSKNGTCVALIGRAFDLDDQERNADIIAQRILDRLASSPDSAIRYAAYLGGRFALFLLNDEKLMAVPDCHSTYAIHSSVSDSGVLFCSHWTLAADILNLPRADHVLAFMNSKEYVSPGGKYYPALWTPYQHLMQVFPNCVATYDLKSKEFSHKRFYPFGPLPGMSPEEAYPEFLHLMKRSMALSSEPGMAVSLTAGGDSTALLAAALLGEGFPADAFSFSYARFSSPTPEAIADIVGANRTAFDARIPHRVLDLKPVDYSCAFHKFYTQSFPQGARYPSLARLYYEDLPHDRTILIGTIAETGTVFYKLRESKSPTREGLAEKFTPSKAKNNEQLLQAFDEYISYVQLYDSLIYNFDWHDLFYWEHRNAKWASLWYAEVDLTGFPIVPYNNRRLIEVMLSLPEEQRRSKYLQKRLISEAGLFLPT